jgi:hypothetical protein
MMLTLSKRSFVRLVLVAGAMIGAGACAATGRPGAASSYLVVDTFEAASGSKPTTFSGTLASDVLTGGGILADPGRASFRLVMKDPAITSPSPVNFITLRGYRVTFSRTDGRNTQGVDVPFAFDGALSATITGTTSVTLVLVRAQAKLEAPLRALAGGGGAIAISTFADVVFYGADQAGHDVTVAARISVNFADWGDEG